MPGLQLPWMQEIGRPVPKRRLPVVLSAEEVLAVLARLQGEHQWLARLLYGTGLRITEALCLRVKDIDFAQRAIYVRQGKGGKHRVVMLPQSLVLPLREQLGRVRQAMIHTHVLRMGGRPVRSPLDSLPGAEAPQSSRW